MFYFHFVLFSVEVAAKYASWTGLISDVKSTRSAGSGFLCLLISLTGRPVITRRHPTEAKGNHPERL